MVFKVFLLVVFVGVAAGSVNVNKMVDAMISDANKYLRAKHLDKVSIPDLSKTWGVDVIINITSSLNCKDGKFRSLASLKRTGDANLIPQYKAAILQFKLELATFETNYGQCDAKLYNKTFDSFDMKASLKGNSIYGQIVIAKKEDDECVAAIEYLQINHLGKISINTTGPLAKYQDIVLGLLAEAYHKSIAKKINRILYQAVENVISKPRFCEIIGS